MTLEKVASRDQMRRAKEALLSGTSRDSFSDLIHKDRAAFSGLRVLYASDVTGAPIQEKLTDTRNVQSIFAGKGVLAFSDAIEDSMRHGEAVISIGTRPLIDTNLFSDLPRFLSGEELKTRDRIEMTLDYLSSTFGSPLLDWSFASLENMREAAKPDNPWPVRKSAAALHYVAYGRTRQSSDQFAEFKPMAIDQWQHWLKSDAMWHQVHRRDMVYAVLLLAFIEAWSGEKIPLALRRMLTFCLDCLGVVPVKELYFGWKLLRGFHQPELALGIFSEPSLRQPKPETLSRMGAAAWDLFLFRWCETQMTETPAFDQQAGVVDFFVPAVTTLDEALLRAIRACPLKALLVHDEGQMVDTVFADELKFHRDLQEEMTADLHQRVFDPVRSANSGLVAPSALNKAIRNLEAKVLTMAGSKPV